MKPFLLRLPSELKVMLEQQAERHGVSINAELVARLRNSLFYEFVGDLRAKTNAHSDALFSLYDDIMDALERLEELEKRLDEKEQSK